MHRRTKAFTVLAAGSLALLGCGGGSGNGLGDIGHVAVRTPSTRVVRVRQLDTSRFDPDSISVKPSETVTLEITNRGSRIHEFFLGADKAQKDREALMQEMGSGPMNMPDKANSVTVEPGATEEITWSFPKRGSVPFGCHQPGEYAKGMKGEIRISP